jgi:chorismate-pyruvate lyase
VNPTGSGAPPKAAAAFARDRFIDPAVDPQAQARHRWLLRLLLTQDGSTTRLCQSIAATPLTLQLLHQGVTQTVPDCVRDVLPGQHFIHRVTALAARGAVMMDNLVYVALDGLSEPLREGLDSGAIPIGPLLESLWVRRKPLPAEVARTLSACLWDMVGVPDPEAARAYTIATPTGNLFVIAETYRRGMRMHFDAPPDALAGAAGPSDVADA